MKSGLPRKRLGDLFVFKNGRAFKKEEWSMKGLPIVRIQNLNNEEALFNYFAGEYSSDIAVEPGDLLFSWSGTVGSSFGAHLWSGKKGVLNQHIFKIGLSETIVKRYAFYALSYITEEIERSVNGAVGLVHITKEKLNEFTILVPPLAEQQRIVGILDEVFEGVAAAKANAKKNLQNAKVLFESYLQSVFAQSGKRWKMEKLDVLTELARGHNPPKSKFSRDPRPGYVRFYQIRDGATDDYAVFVPDTPQLHKMKKDDIMMVAYRHVGRAFRGVEGAFNVALCKISNVRRDLLNDDYLYLLIPSQFVKGELLKRSERSLIPSMSIEHLRELKIPLPPLDEQHRIVKSVNNISTETERLTNLYERKLIALEELKKSLLHQAFTGELAATEESLEVTSFPVQIPNISPTDLHAGVLAMAYQLHEKNGKQEFFGHVKAEKITHMAEALLGIDLGRSPVKDAAGPNDFPHLQRVEHRARKANYFDFKRVEGLTYRVQKLHGFQRLVDKTCTALGPRCAELEHLLQLMLPMDAQQAEIMATVFAAWNNLLLEDKQPTDEQIVFEARENWHPDKLKIERQRFFKAVQWLRDKGKVPQGKGKTVKSKGK
ncbi:MAG TPA: restriction endonuclease subunit S [Candidatus Angelobacter sp.]|jgi:restriction endonuclease S subunit